MTSAYVRRVKILIGEDAVTDEVLNEIEENTVALFKAVTGDDIVPPQFDFMIREVMIKRFNRIGAEGMSSEKQGDLTLVYDSSDFDSYASILDKHYQHPKGNRERGGVFFR